jgi:biopolymer transport protein ExbD
MANAVTRIRKQKKQMSLQVTSLLDMFTIILVFLMVSFQAEDKDFVLNAEVKLPESTAKNPFKTAVNLAITRKAVLVEGKKIYDLHGGGKVKDSDVANNKIEAITQGVKRAWDHKKKEAGEEDVVVIQADKRIPYKTIHLVMRSAAYSGFYRFRLAIVKE